MTAAPLRRHRWLLGALLVIASAWASSSKAELRASVEPRIIDELDTARLTIRTTDGNQVVPLDLQPLEQDFEVLTTQSSSQYRSINGKVESWVEYQVMLRPRRAGDLTIPPIHIGSDSTRPLTLQVRSIEPALRDAIERMVFFETEVSTNPVYVQAETVLVRRLYYSSGAQIYSDLPGLPEIPDAVVVPLGETTSSTLILDGQRYGVIEQRFAIFPEQSGPMTIPAIAVTSSVRLQSGGRTRRSGVRIATQPITLEVLPIPPEYPSDHPWLPARDVSLYVTWSPDQRRYQVGDPITRTLRAEVSGNVSSVIPPLDPGLPDGHFRDYPEPPQLENDSSGTTVHGVRQRTSALIPTAPGEMTLPPVELVWWDVTSRQVRTARAPARTVHILGSAAPAPQEPAPPPAAAADPMGTQPAAPAEPTRGDVDVRSDHVPWPGPERRRALWLLALVVSLAAILTALLLRLRLRVRLRTRTRTRTRTPRPQRALAARADTERVHWRELKRACRGRDQHALHRALLAFLCAHFHASAPEATRRFRRAGYGDLLARLNAALYRRADAGDAAGVSGQEILDAVRSLHSRRARDHARGELPALYD